MNEVMNKITESLLTVEDWIVGFGFVVGFAYATAPVPPGPTHAQQDPQHGRHDADHGGHEPDGAEHAVRIAGRLRSSWWKMTTKMIIRPNFERK